MTDSTADVADGREQEFGSTADLMDARGQELDSCDLQFRQYGGHRKFHGTVRTARCRDDNALIRHVLSTPGPGQVLVVEGGGSYRTALMGDLIATTAIENGWAGVIIYGSVRDVGALSRLPFGVKAMGSNPRRSAKLGSGEVDVPVSFGGATFVPGVVVYSDDDGIVVERKAQAGE